MMAFSRRNTDNDIPLTISTSTLLKVIVTIIGTILLLAALRRATHALTLIFIAFFLALALNGPVHWVSVTYQVKAGEAVLSLLAFPS